MKAKLVWQDLFEKDGSPDKNIWNIDTGGSGFGNKEDQFYTDRLDNVFVKDGMLHIYSKKENYENRNYTSGKVNTFGKKEMRYGRIEVCAELPKGLGTWPAIWMLGANRRDGVRWPLCGEIDIMEHVGKNPEFIHFSLHSQNKNHKENTHYTKALKIENVLDGFHTYRIDWTLNEISFYVDDIKYAEFKNELNEDEETWPFNAPFYLIINTAIGGTWGGRIDDDNLPQDFKIKFVKVYDWEKEDN